MPTPEPEPEQPAAEAALEAPPAQKALSKRSLAAEVAMLSGPLATVVLQPEGERDAAVLANGDAAEPAAVAEQTPTAAGSADAAVAVPMQKKGAAAAANTGAAAAGVAPEAVAAAVDPLQALKKELLAVLDWVPFDAFHRVRGSPERREQLRGVVLAAHTSKVRAWQQWMPGLMQVRVQGAHSECRLPPLSAGCSLRVRAAHSAVVYLQAAAVQTSPPLRLLAAPLRCVRQSASAGQVVASDLQVLAAAVLVLEGMLTEDRWKPHWRLWRMPAPHPSIAGERPPCPA